MGKLTRRGGVSTHREKWGHPPTARSVFSTRGEQVGDRGVGRGGHGWCRSQRLNCTDEWKQEPVSRVVISNRNQRVSMPPSGMATDA